MSDKRLYWIEDAESQVSAGLEACMPTVCRIPSFLHPRIYLAARYGIQLRTLTSRETDFYFSDNLRQPRAAIKSRHLLQRFTYRKANCAMVVFSWLVLLPDRSAHVLKPWKQDLEEGYRLPDHTFQCSGGYFLDEHGQRDG